nr:hypothetical protein 29 [bacterium]
MPNWCSNRIEISAEPHVLDALMEKAKGKIDPSGEEESAFSYFPFVEHIFSKDCKNDWLRILGCKWFPNIETITREEKRVSLDFETAWSPSLDGTRNVATWLKKQGYKFNITHLYEEGGESFCGLLEIDETDENHQQGLISFLDEGSLKGTSSEDWEEECEMLGVSFDEFKETLKREGEITVCPKFYQEYRRYS